MQRGIKKKTFAGRSEVKGYGLFIGYVHSAVQRDWKTLTSLSEAIKKFEFIDEYVGEIITQSEADRRMTRHRKGDCNYQFEVNTEQTIDSAHFGNLTRFINHSSDAPNCKSTVKLVNAEHRIGFYALRDIKRHEELLFDYGVTFANELKEQYADNGDVDEEMADAPADDEDDIEDEDDDVIADEDEDQDVSPSESETAVEDTIDQALVKPRRVDGMIFDDTDEEM